MAVEVHWVSGSPFAWRVLLTLELKKVAYQSRLLQVSAGENRAPEFLALNPRGRVPVLRDNDYVLPESLAIMAYLDRKHPDPPLFGGSAKTVGQVWRAVLDFDFYVAGEAMTRVVLPIYFGQVEEDEVREAAEEVRAELGRMEKTLAGQAWLVGDAMSAADIAVYPFIETLLRAASKKQAAALDLGWSPLGERFPALEAWRARIAALPGSDRAYPPHWREAA